MTPRSLALVLGFAYVGLGALGFMPGALAGLFPVNPSLACAAFVFAGLALVVGLLLGLDRFLIVGWHPSTGERRDGTAERRKAPAAA